MTRYNLILNKIKELKSQNNMDSFVLRALFGFNQDVISNEKVKVNNQEFYIYSSGSDDSIQYSQLKNFSNLLPFFNKENFLKNPNLNDLFQEVHNRYMIEQGYDVKKKVQQNTQKEDMDTTIAYVCHDTSELAINYSLLNYTAILPVTKSSAINRENVNLMFLNTVCHESQHCCQFEYALDLLMDKNLSDDKKFLGALMLISTTNSIYSEDNKDFIHSLKDKYSYKYQFLEHDANYSAYKKVEELLNERKVKDLENQNLDAYYYGASVLGTRAEYIMFPNHYTKNRVSKMEGCAKYQIEYFKKNINTNCEFCQKVLEIVDDYMQVDENGNSKFRSKLKNDILEMAKVQVKARKETINNCY